MRTLVIGDIHYKTGNRDLTDNMEKIALDYLTNTQVDIIVLLGDVLHDHNRVRTDVKHRAIQFMQRLAEYANCYVIMGNHDLINNTECLTEVHCFEGVNLPGVTFVSKPLQVNNVLFAPYVPPGQFREMIEPYDVDYIFAHQEFRGANLGHGMESNGGDIWDQDKPMVISGHIHRRQLLRGVFYTGAAIQTNFGETWDTFIYSMILGTNLEIDDIPTMTVGRYVTHEINVGDKLPDPAQDKVRLIVHGTKEECVTFRRKYNLDVYDKVLYRIRDSVDDFDDVAMDVVTNITQLESLMRQRIDFTEEHDAIWKRVIPA
jgi:hypothetical protein